MLAPKGRDVATTNLDPDALATSATDLARGGRLLEAEALCRQALAGAPGHVAALAVLGHVLHGTERYGEAEEVYTELTDRVPDDADFWMHLGTVRRCRQQYEPALIAYSRAAQLGGTSADFYFNVGLLHLERRDYEAARAVLKCGLELAPEDAELRFQYAKACFESLQTEEAIEALRGWDAPPDAAPEFVADVGHQLLSLGQTADAERWAERSAGGASFNPRAALTLVQIYERTNRLAEARALIDRVAADPRAGALHRDLLLTEARLAQREGRHETAAQLLTHALAQDRGDFANRHFELFPLAASLDALGRYPDAFAVLLEAHRSQVAHLQQTAPSTILRGMPRLDIAQYASDPADVARWCDEPAAPPAAASPVFIVAFPRSGTTLLEVALDAHPALVSIDEQALVQKSLDDMLALGVAYPERLAGLDAGQLAALRAAYWRRAAGHAEIATGQRLVDKNPLNMLRLPVIRRLFPNARIVMAIRHPCDVLASCFMQHFRAPEFALLCSDLDTLAAGYLRAFDAWYREVGLLQPAVRELRYETLVEDFEGEMRSLLGFLELPWDDAVLAPATRAIQKKYISTPSYAQVVRPVNSASIGRWRRYQSELAPVAAAVRPYLERWGYDA